MPSKHTFRIKPIRDLLTRYVGNGIGWADPFSGENSFAEYTNDLNPKKPTTHHLHCDDFASVLKVVLNGVLFDPPYTTKQTKELYEGFGMKFDAKATRECVHFSKCKNILAPKVAKGGYAISFGYNSNGFGKKRGFEIVEILLVAHGRAHNDTIVVVERKI